MKLYEQGQPYAVEVNAGDSVYLCQCGLTQTPPFCDGSHKATDKTPFAHTAESKETIYVCGCGKSGNLPFCDGSHNS
ncbi:MAG: CDGSH iron-sulfur domain-containing protein [Gammaproteobacteria bacterium]